MRTKRYRDEILASSSGSTSIKHTSPERIMKFKFLLPPVPLIRDFDSIAEVFFEKIIVIEEEDNVLEQLQRYLIRELISGKTRIKENFEQYRRILN